MVSVVEQVTVTVVKAADGPQPGQAAVVSVMSDIGVFHRVSRRCVHSVNWRTLGHVGLLNDIKLVAILGNDVVSILNDVVPSTLYG